MTPVTVVVVTHNSATHIEALLDSLPLAMSGAPWSVIVVDSGSSDATVDVLRRRRDVTLVEAGGNVGYAAGINIARRIAGRDANIAILNPDLVLRPGSLAELSSVLEDATIGVAVPRLVDAAGAISPHLRREVSVANAFGEALFGDHWPERPEWLSEVIRRPEEYRSGHDVPWAGGAALMVSSDCNAAVGDWREDFFLYAEETDFMLRAGDAGYRVRYTPAAMAEHVGGGSGTSPDLVALMVVNRWRLYRSRHPRWRSAAYFAALATTQLLRAGQPRHRHVLAALVSPGRRAALPRGDAPHPRVLHSPATSSQA